MKSKKIDTIENIVIWTWLVITTICAAFSPLIVYDIGKLEKENEALWSALYDNQVRINGVADIQRQQAEVVIQIADKINGAVVMGISDKEVFEEMKRREAFLTE